MQWYHYIFDPTSAVEGGDFPKDYWKYQVFRDAYLEAGTPPSNILDLFLNEDMDAYINMWKNDPFNPHAIAKFRNIAYMTNVVMKYIDNLVSWGDMLFKQDSLESLNEATQLYLIAAKILGRKPEKVKGSDRVATTFGEHIHDWNSFGNVLVDIEDYVGVSGNELGGNTQIMNPFQNNMPEIEGALNLIQSTISQQGFVNSAMSVGEGEDDNAGTKASTGQVLYFCLPVNDKMLGYWDIVADRLFKLRNCMNIKGIVRQLPLFQAPIDPGALIKAKAAGLDISSALADMNATLPLYRFKNNIQKALELAGEVKSLGGALLSALEKRDAEDIALIRSSHKFEMQKAMTLIREKGIKEAENSKESLELSKALVIERKNYYSDRDRTNDGEDFQLYMFDSSMITQMVAAGLGGVNTVLSLYPTITLGLEGAFCSPVVTSSWGVQNLMGAINSAIGVLGQLSGIMQTAGSKSATNASYDRRLEEWNHQAKLARLEIPQIEKQIAGAELKIEMANVELENLLTQIDQAETEMAFLEDKFTNKELYSWMASQVSTLYFQSYQMAYDMAKRAEMAFRFELGLEDSSFIQFGYWDGLKKGLLAGEKLYKDLQRMDVAYMEQNAREYELTKHFSLAAIDPNALMDLRNTGSCFFDIPEVFYDLDYPGHYFRRIKSVSITIPAVTGPYTNVNCRLTMVNNRYRKNTNNGSEGGDYVEKTNNDPRFIYNSVSMQSIATSTAQNDSGLFQFDFKDERYLPFEGAGAIGSWKLDMPDQYRQFDYDTIADAIITINYTAREGGDTLAAGAVSAIDDTLNLIGNQNIGLHQMLSMKAQFANELDALSNGSTADIKINLKHFPHFFNRKIMQFGAKIEVVSLTLFTKSVSDLTQYSINSVNWVDLDGNTELISVKRYSLSLNLTNFSDLDSTNMEESISVLSSDSLPDDVDEILIMVKYKIVNS
jgi:hypothetical protein